MTTRVSFALACIVTLSCATFARSARADEGPPPTVEEPALGAWYGWQTLACDGVAVGLMSVSIARGFDKKSLPFSISSLVVYYAGAPIVHAAHGEGRRVRASLELRTYVPLVGAGVAFLTALIAGGGIGDRSPNDKQTAANDVAIGILAVGFIVPIVYDAITAREHAPAIQPSIAPVTGGGAVVGLSAVF